MTKKMRIGPVWVTKYALSIGIQRYELVDQDDDMICVILGGYFHGEGREWHRTESAAFSRAEQMRKDRIKSLEKQIAKLKNLRFVVRSLDNCDHKWKDVDAMADNEVRCVRCGVTGARISDTEVYWPAT